MFRYKNIDNFERDFDELFYILKTAICVVVNDYMFRCKLMFKCKNVDNLYRDSDELFYRLTMDMSIWLVVEI